MMGKLPTAPLGAAALAVVAVVLAGCSLSATDTSTGAGAHDAAGLPYEHVHGLGVDPADGAVYVATHDGLFRAGADGLQRAGTTGRDLMGFTITGPGTFLSSGHPGPDEPVANPLGLVESTDAGTSWTTLALAGEVDFHALEVSAGTVFGYDATNQIVRVSEDGGRSWQTRAALPALDIAADPADPAALLATVEGGVAVSGDGGRSFAAPTGPQLAYLSWAGDGTVYGLGLEGTVFRSGDGGTSWAPAGIVPGGRPQALTATAGTLLAATAGGVYRSDDGGATFTPIT
jgi:hypothetical protein